MRAAIDTPEEPARKPVHAERIDEDELLSGDSGELGDHQLDVRIREMVRDVRAQRVVERGVVEGERGGTCNDALDVFVHLAKPVELSLVDVERHISHVRRKQPVEGAGAGAYVEQRAGTELGRESGRVDAEAAPIPAARWTAS